jgi:hypothetical protein
MREYTNARLEGGILAHESDVHGGSLMGES